ncbi:MAG: ABC transporter ATP-binding protein [Thiohalobacteraceae bacterium]
MERLRAEAIQGAGWGPLNLTVGAGECLCLQGPSGAGKTRLLRALADLDPHGGQVYLDDVVAARIPPPQWRREVALLPADSRWWATTVAEHFPKRARLDPASVGLPAAALHWTVERLSSGERQRLALLRLLANQPKVLLLDEPTANLDAANVARIETLIADYRRIHSAAVLWVSHDQEQIARIADRCATIENGRLTALIEVAA